MSSKKSCETRQLPRNRDVDGNKTKSSGAAIRLGAARKRSGVGTIPQKLRRRREQQKPGRNENKKQTTHMLTRSGHGLIIDCVTNVAAELGQELLLDSRLQIFAAASL